MWGQVADETNRDNGERIIPTRVGTRTKCNFVKFGNWDHPHACGDKFRRFVTLKAKKGSSPRVWGQEKLYSEKELKERIIPTRVGTRVQTILHSDYFEDHPHACGDKQKVVAFI